MTTIPTLASFASGWLDSLEPEYYRNIAPKYYHTPRRYQHADHPLHCIVIPSFNAIQQKNKEEKKSAVSMIGNDGFQVCMDVEHLKPNELTVKTVDNCIVVEGKHEEIPDEHGFISRSFVRRYILPDGYDPQQTVSTLSSDGILTIKVPQPQKTQSNERIVHIQQTGPAHLTVKDNKEDKDGKEQKKEKK